MAAKLLRSQSCRFCMQNYLQNSVKTSILCIAQRKIHKVPRNLWNALEKQYLNTLKFPHSKPTFQNELNSRCGAILISNRRYSASKNLEEDLEDIRLLLQSQLSRDNKITQDELAKQMSIVDVLLQSRTQNISAHFLRDAISTSSAGDLYLLASRIFQLQSKVGEEASMVATPLFREAALAGDKNAKYSYGQLLFRGVGGLEADPIEAGVMFTELAKEGHPFAQFTLAAMHYAGYGVEQSLETAYTLYQVAAENGVLQSFNHIGKLYLNGEGVEKDEKKAFEYFMKGAEKGDPQACMSVAHCYSSGKAVDVNFDQAFLYHQRAADAGYIPGVYNLGTHYFAGKGVALNMQKALELFQKAADQGFSLAEVNLANMYYNGFGVEQDVQKAKELYAKAAPHNHNARLILEEIELEEKKKESDNNEE